MNPMEYSEGIKFFEFDSKQKLLDIYESALWTFRQMAVCGAFAALVWEYVSDSRQRGVTARKWDWKRDWNRPGISRNPNRRVCLSY